MKYACKSPHTAVQGGAHKSEFPQSIKTILPHGSQTCGCEWPANERKLDCHPIALEVRDAHKIASRTSGDYEVL